MKDLLPPPNPPAPKPMGEARDVMTKHGLEWLAPLVDGGNRRRIMSVPEAARALDCGQTFVRQMIGMNLVEWLRVGHDFRIFRRSLLVHLWQNWSGRDQASEPQLVVFLLTLLPHLPTKALMIVRNAIDNLINSKLAAEQALGLHAKRKATPAVATPELFPEDV
jgi:hypothetical protein